MGWLKKAEHFFDDHILHPGRGTRSEEWKGTDPELAAEGIASVLTGGELTFGKLGLDVIKQTAQAIERSGKQTVAKQVKRKAKSFRNVARSGIRDFQHYSGKAQENSAMSGGNRYKAGIPLDAKRVYESRYFEVYRDSKGETHLWGKPTLGPNSFKKDPAGFLREWGENYLRLDPKYRKSDPLYRDMARIKRKFGKVDHISGYSRGGAAAQYQSAKDSKSSRIFGPYVPVGGIGDHRVRRTPYFDPVHVVARGITKHGRSIRFLNRARRL